MHVIRRLHRHRPRLESLHEHRRHPPPRARAFFRRIQSRHGRQVAIKATAHKLALIFYAMLKNGAEYRPTSSNHYEQRYRQTLLKSLTKKASALGFTLTPNEEVH